MNKLHQSACAAYAQHLPLVAAAILAQPVTRFAEEAAGLASGESRAETKRTFSSSACRVIARERLLDQMLKARRRRCIVLQGPVGCGKTSLLLAWRESLLLLGFDIAWQTFTAEENDLARCLDGLIASLAQIGVEISNEAALLLERGVNEEAIERIVIALVRGIAQHPNDIALILDDVHCMTNGQNLEALQWLLDFAPSNLHIVLVSRTAVPLSLGRLRAQDLVLELDACDLRFTLEETETFLKAQLGEINPREVRRIHELTDGWVTGLQLFAIRLKRVGQEKAELTSARALSPASLPDARTLDELFEREVFSRLSSLEVTLLISMSVCARLCNSLCIALGGVQQQPADVLALLAKLENENLFITPVMGSSADAGHSGWYSFNPLFREILLGRFRAQSSDAQREVHRAAWIWFRDHDHAEEAVRHALLAGELDTAVQLVRQMAKTLRISGFRKLANLIRLLPADEIHKHIDLRLWMAMLHLYAQNFEACAADIRALQRDIAPDDHSALYQLTVLQVVLGVQQDNVDAVVELVPTLMQVPENADGLMVGSCNNILSWFYAHKGEYEEARRIQTESPKLLVNGAVLLGAAAGMLNGRCLMGFSYSLEGKFVQAERIYRDVLFESKRVGGQASESTSLSSALLGEVLYETNELAAARKLLEDHIDILERVSIPDTVLRVFMTLAAIHWVAGQPQETFAYLARLEEYATRFGLDRLAAASVSEQVCRHLLRGQFDAAQSGLARLDELTARCRAPSTIFSDEIHVAVERAHIHWLLAHEDFNTASSKLRALIALCEARGWQRHWVAFQMQTALIDARLGRLEAARQTVLDVLPRASRLGLVRTLIDAGPTALGLITQVMQSEPPDPILSFYLSRLQAAQLLSEVSEATAATSNATAQRFIEALSEREAKVVSLLAQALPNKKIARTLGISPETVKWHLKNIYGKLGVSSRDEAVARVRDLNFDTAPHAHDAHALG